MSIAALTRKTISICIPVYNEAANLTVAVREVEALFQKELSAYHLELIVTDNGSTDETWAVVQSLGQTRQNLKGFRFSRNFGYQNSVFTGLSMSTGDAVIELDADLEDPPHVIPRFVAEWESGFEVVYGVRAKRFGSWFKRALFYIFYRLLNSVSDYKIPPDAGDFRLLDRKVVDRLKLLGERNLYLRGLVVFLGFRQCPVSYERQPRISGRSKFRPLHYLVMAIDAFTAFTKAPLRLIGVLGVSLFTFSMALSAYYLIGHLRHGTPVAGFTTLVILTLFLHSMTFIFLSILGEYLARIFDESKGRPRVIIDQAVNAPDFPKVL